MENILTILENPVVSLIAGALFSFILSYFLNRQNNIHASKMLDKKHLFESDKDLKAKKFEAYMWFAESRSIIHQYWFIKKNHKHNLTTMLTINNKYKAFLKEINYKISLLSFYASREIIEKITEFSLKYQSINQENYTEMMEDYEKIMVLMIKDLGIEK